MALCEQGYLCDVCGKDVADLSDSDLYLRYILGEVDPDTLHSQPERHLRCNPILAQFIVDERFEPIEVDGFFSKTELDPVFVEKEEDRVTRGFQRLQELPNLDIPITEYPLPEVLEMWAESIREEQEAAESAHILAFADAVKTHRTR